MGLTFFDSDMFKKNEYGRIQPTVKEVKSVDDMSEDARSTYEINKKTTIRFLGYDPFENEPIDE